MVKTDTAELKNLGGLSSFQVSSRMAAVGFFIALVGVSFFAYNWYIVDTLHTPYEPPTVEFQEYNMLLYVFLGSGFMILATVMNWFAYSHSRLHAFIPGLIISLVGTGVSIFASIVMVYFFNVNFINYPL